LQRTLNPYGGTRISKYLDRQFSSGKPRELSLTAGRILAKKHVTKIAIRRRGQQACNGAMRGELTIRKVGFTASSPQTQVIEGTGKLKIDIRSEISLTGSPVVSERLRSTNWWLKLKAPSLILSHVVDREVEWIAPKGIDYIWVYPRDASKFQGGLYAFAPDRSRPIFSATISNIFDNTQYTGGVGSRFGTIGGKYYGVTLDDVTQGSLVRYVTATQSLRATSKALIELKLDLYGESSSTLSTPQAVSSWLAGTQKSVSWSTVIDATKPAGFSTLFPSSEWSYEISTPFAVEEFAPVGDENLSYPLTELWTGQFRFPVRLND
jgi:hypothetical protein